MNKDVLQKNMPVISSIISSAEDRIYNSTGLQIKLQVKDTEAEYIGVDNLINKAATALCTIWDVKIFDVFQKKRTRHLVAMRSIIFHYIRYKYPTVGLVQIANHFGNLDHSTIIHNVERAKQFIRINDQLFHSYYQPIKHLYDEPKI